jgi:hypothetical protein
MTALNDAYRRTAYMVDAPDDRLTIRIGDPHPALDQLAARLLGTDAPTTWCHITAHNPRSEALTDAENDRRTEALEEDLRELQATFHARDGRSLSWLPGEGRSPDGQWAEAGFFVAGISPLTAWVLGARYQQNAVVTGSTGGAARLTWVVGPDPSEGCAVADPPPEVHGTGAALIEALETVHAQLSERRSPDSGIIQRLNQPWPRVVEASWEVLWWQAKADGASLDDITTLPSVMEDFDRPSPLTVRRLPVVWSDGRVLHVVCLVSVEDEGVLHHHATGFGLSADAALAALAEREAAIFGRLNPSEAIPLTTLALQEAFDGE